MDFSIAKTDGDFVVFTTHQTGPADGSPLQLISDERLAELMEIEAAAKAKTVPQNSDEKPASPEVSGA